MAKNLVIVESPAKAKTIAKMLGKDFQVKASAGHIRDLPKKGIGVNIKKNFEPVYEVLPEKAEVVKELQEAASKAKTIYLAPDPDREGEAIAWHLACLLGDGANLKRIEFNEITKDAITRAIKHPRDIDIQRVNAQQARRVLDRLVGYKISPLLWQKVRRGLSAGRVQSVAVRLICDREKEIQAFTPQEYWSITAELNKGKSAAFAAELAKWKGKKLDVDNEKTATAIVGALNESEFKVTKIQTKEQKRQPGAPFITSTLQQEASRRYGFTVKRTMTLAQQLYEGVELGEEGPVGLITYMRTDSTRIAKEAQEEAASFITEKWTKAYLPDSPRQYKSRKGAQEAHEAIRPTSVFRTPDVVKKNLSADQFKLYKLVWERFMASQMSNAVLSVLTVEITGGDGVFRVSDTKVVFAGYQALYTELSENEEDPQEEKKPSKLPDLAEGDVLKLKAITPKQHFTQPPPRFTEASLVKALEEQGIGRPSTYAPTISTVQQRGYVEKDGRALKPTDLGLQVNDQLVAHFPNIVDTNFTADMENKLDNVESGGEEWQQLIGNFYGPFAETLKVAAKEMKPVELPSGIKCEVCDGGEYMIKSGRFGEFLACNKYPECKSTKPIIKKIGMKCPTCSTGEVIEKRSRTGKTFYGCERWPDCSFTSWDQPTETKCVKCATMMVIKRSKAGRTFMLCTNLECKNIQNMPRKRDAAAEGEGEGEQEAEKAEA